MSYVQSTNACSEPNSATPMSAARIAAQDRRVAAVGARFVAGNLALNNIEIALGGNPGSNAGGSPLGDAGVPTVGPTGRPLLINPGDAVPPASPGGLVNYGYRGLGRRPVRGAAVACSAPTVLPMATVFPIPLPVAAPAATPPVAIPAPAVPVPAAPKLTQAQCRTGNICLDILNGCVAQSQVDPQQTLLCAQRGYSGNRSLYPLVQWLPLPYLGMVDSNPPQATPALLGKTPPGLSGLGDWWGDNSQMVIGVGGILGAALLFSYIISSGEKQKRRRRAMDRVLDAGRY